MSDRCPKCAALVKPGAQWCSLCYADLRPQPEPVPVPVPASVASAAGGGLTEVIDPLTAPLSALEQMDGFGGAGVIETAGAVPQEESEPTTAGWPCARCGAVVALELSMCDTCGAGFLSPGSRVASRRSRLDDVVARAGDKRVRVAIMVLGGAFLSVVLFGLMVLIGSVL